MSIRIRTIVPSLGALLVVGASSSVLRAQAPVAQQGATPLVWTRLDSIYRLAVDTSYKLDRTTLHLLDESVIRYEADGRGSKTIHQVTQILKREAVEGMAERQLAWSPDRQTMTVNWIKVLKPNGEVISEAPAQVQDSDVPAAMANPVYGNRRVRRMSLSGLAVGTLLDVSYTIRDTAAYPPRDQFYSWLVSTSTEVKRSNLVVDVPESVRLAVVEENLDFKRREVVANGRRIYQWTRTDVPWYRPERFAAYDSNKVDMRVRIGFPIAWKDIGLWYDGLARERYALGDTARGRIRTAVAGARTRQDSIKGLHKLVAKDVRYVSVSLGIGGYQPRFPDTVAVTGFGDCKDKATYFVAALRAWGVRAHPVLIRSIGPVDTRLPSARQFDHAIAAVETGSGYQFVDLTASTIPYGELPPNLYGQFAIVVRSDGRVEEVRLPEEPAGRERILTRYTGEITADGLFNGRMEQLPNGASGQALRSLLDNPLDSTRRANLIRSLASSVYPGAIGDSLELFDAKDPAATPRIAVRVRGGRAATKSGTTMILNLSLGNHAGVTTTIEEMQAAPQRRYPIDARAVFGTGVTETEFRVRLPDGFDAQLPEGVRAKSAFGELLTEYRQEGRELIIRRVRTGARGVHPPDKVPELLAWMRELTKDDVRFVVLTPTTR